MKKNDRRKRKLQEEACDYEIERTPTTRYEPDYEEGLTSAQAEEHRRDGWGNISVDPPAQTTEEIIKENVFTYFNLIFLVLAILLIIVGSFRNLHTSMYHFCISTDLISCFKDYNIIQNQTLRIDP